MKNKLPFNVFSHFKPKLIKSFLTDILENFWGIREYPYNSVSHHFSVQSGIIVVFWYLIFQKFIEIGDIFSVFTGHQLAGDIRAFKCSSLCTITVFLSPGQTSKITHGAGPYFIKITLIRTWNFICIRNSWFSKL